ncbi:MAG: ABC transporter ATP-binding protein [Gammaproteobacteria bacterium]|nr:ABC transporter ATP-binding protein [Gammaproteobacteria bacterium]
MTDELIKLQNVGVCYRSQSFLKSNREKWALNDIDMTLNRGDTLGIIGRNGVGKSTLLKLLADIITPDRGVIERKPCRSTLLSLRVGFLNHLNARENAIMAGMLLGLSRKEIESRLDAILEFAELTDSANVPIGTFSTGMSARLGFSIAMQIDPDVLLLDEMLAVGDASFKEKSSRAIRQRMKSDKTVVVVAHNELVIRELCNKVLWIENGRTMATGNADEVFEQYKSYLAERSVNTGI